MKNTALTLVLTWVFGFGIQAYGADYREPGKLSEQPHAAQHMETGRFPEEPQIVQHTEPSNLSMLRVTITNSTAGQVLTPPLVILHNGSYNLFFPGESASGALTLLAEEGIADWVVQSLTSNGNVYDFALSDRELLPGETVILLLQISGVPLGQEARLTVLGMLATTNDGFYAVNNAQVLSDKGILRTDFEAIAYDAGTEVNNESCNFIPGSPCGSSGQRNTRGAEGFIHVHRGIHGIGDLNPAVFDWRNPVAMVEVSLR